MFYIHDIPIYETDKDGIESEIIDYGGEAWFWDNHYDSWVITMTMLMDFQEEQQRFPYWTYKDNLPNMSGL